jgi:hypothetical protein
MDQVRAGNDQIQGAIASGQLKMNPESAEKAAKVYEDKADQVFELMKDANKLARVGGLGEYPSAKQLAGKFEAKAADGSSGAVKLLQDLEKELRRKADLFRQAAKDYVATDEQNAHDIGRGMR